MSSSGTTSLATLTGVESRLAIRAGRHVGPTAGVAAGYVQANIVVLPRDLAFEFLVFCQRNPKPCPVLEVLEAGQTEARITAPGSDIRSDAPKYRVYRNGSLVDEIRNLLDVWQDDFVTFLLGCSFTFENALVHRGIRLPHAESAGNVAMFITNIQTVAAGPFAGPLVVSMRWIPTDRVVQAVQVTSRFPSVHGAPVHIGDPNAIGIQEITKPDFGDDWSPSSPSDVPVFWACGVTPQAVAISAKIPLMITHSPGHMFVTDWKDEDLAII